MEFDPLWLFTKTLMIGHPNLILSLPYWLYHVRMPFTSGETRMQTLYPTMTFFSLLTSSSEALYSSNSFCIDSATVGKGLTHKKEIMHRQAFSGGTFT